jgi:hypothetical protein
MMEVWSGGGAVMEEAVRLGEANRKQLIVHPTDLDGLLEAEHPARAIWRVLEGLELRRFAESIKARGERRARRDRPQDSAGAVAIRTESGREPRARTGAAEHAAAAYRWICGRGNGQLQRMTACRCKGICGTQH